MTSDWQYEANDAAQRATGASHGFPTRIAAAIVILVALVFMDTAPRSAFDAGFGEQPRPEQRAPAACGAEAVARAQREVNRTRASSPSAVS